VLLTWSIDDSVDGRGGDSLGNIFYKVEFAKKDDNTLEAYQSITERTTQTRQSVTTTGNGLVFGNSYRFRITVWNSYGSSSSDQYDILFAMEPTAPTPVTTENSARDIIIEWFAGGEQGAPITNYLVYVQNKKTNQYVQLGDSVCIWESFFDPR
jgi:hypothetical protein